MVHVKPRDFTALLEALEAQSVVDRALIAQHKAQAESYVWGWQDAGGAEHDTNVSWEFGVAYAWHAYDFATEARVSRMSIQRAFAEWTSTGSIGD